MLVERSPSSHSRLVVRDGPDELPSSLMISPGSPCFSQRTSLCSSSLCAEGLLWMSSGWLISGSPTECWERGHLCRGIRREFAASLIGTWLSLPPESLRISE